MAERLPGIRLLEDNHTLMAAFTYGCNTCPAKKDCNPSFHLQETPRAIRGHLAGDLDQCQIVKDERWASRVEVLEPIKMR